MQILIKVLTPGLRPRASMVPAIPGCGDAVGPGANHHVQASRAYHHREQGGGVRWKLVSYIQY